MFKKKISSVTTAVASAAAATAAAAKVHAPATRGSKAKTLALIEKHRKILEEARRQKEEMDQLTLEQGELQQQKLTHITVAPPSPATSSAASSAAVKEEPPRDTFTALVEHFLASTQPLADLDETIQEADSSSGASSEAPFKSLPPRQPRSATASASPSIITYRSFAASLVCPKKLFLLQNRSDLIPKASLGDMMHFDDSVGFNELVRRWDRLQFGSRAVLVKENEFYQAVQRTEQLITTYFQGPYKSLAEQAPSLTIHRPAFAVEFPGGAHQTRADGRGSSAAAADSAVMELRARPAVVRYRPKENQWVFLDSQAVIDPLSSPSRISSFVQRFHFTALCFRLWLTQPHLPIEVRKKFLQVDLDSITCENLGGRSLESSARAAAPIDLKRSGLLHIRQFLPGPATLMDCDPPRLVKFIQRVSLEELIAEDSKHYSKDGRGRQYSNATARAGGGGADYFSHHGLGGGGGAGGAFDLRNFTSAIASHPVLAGHAAEVELAALGLGDFHNSRATRSQRHKDEVHHRLFEAEQRFMEELLRQHTLPLVKRQQQQMAAFSSAEGPASSPLTAFSNLLGDDGFVRASCAADAVDNGKHKKGVKSAAQIVKGAAAGGRGKRKAPAAGEDEESKAEAEAEEDAGDVGMGGGDNIDSPCYARYVGTHCLRGGDACPFFTEGMCLPRKVDNAIVARDNHLFTLPSTSLARKAAWWAQGKRTVRDVLAAYERGESGVRLTSPQVRYANALRQGKVALNPKEIDAFFDRIQYPLFVIDFEAVQFALPPFAKEVAYQSIPFQFSLDVFQHDVLTEEPTHYNYLHFGKGYSPNTDPRPACIAELIRIVRLEREKKRKAMEASGELERIASARAAEEAAAAEASGRRRRRGKMPKPPKITKSNPLEQPLHPYDGCFIAHFASFEKACLEKLGQLEEKYKDEIKSFWFLDTLDLIKKGYLHPNAHGSNSLKKVLPALCPDFQYGVFGSEATVMVTANDGLLGVGGRGNAAPVSDASVAKGSAGEGQDEQKGENAMGVYRLWHHMEGGGTVQDLERAKLSLSGGTQQTPNWSESVRTTMTKEERDRMWQTLRIQLLEYCSLDTKALYEIMREIYKEREAAAGVKPHDKTGWVLIDPVPREVDF
ncbi:Domain of unknown function(DUF2779) [Leishmania donovani]|uniref:Domain_of_uncharacterized_function(DUF2779)_-_put ative n=3 Tax=Leishmania donovani species complex TaxID=38574 RepID=A0A6L0WJT0_LEIIN|nr:conserved hypothetical protein [Leishmania infantum JPCM5]CAC9460198.1 Domain_of_uncharacterised_function(DUF2779)_-_putative [Leishmania infantum]CAJ1986863.1 Domain of unknown function(DUF2779) [Leishmania donovani]CAM66210.1 conserved hypothetical protein [Leishmania infantum JPCM5]SUZ39818.1 Domain_of_uncharacterised_function(DUF2779)_-_putative [Leishmania infantum]VDZ42756.1 Domain_of_unknown_function(DUF2779)_putative/Pfam:PF11074 [Leishmania donovani]|eukprot:XP_001463840.1 conserved hypothetical protein [Leishmania infantum JPCM5]